MIDNQSFERAMGLAMNVSRVRNFIYDGRKITQTIN